MSTMPTILSPITPENAVLSAGRTIADLKKMDEVGEFVYIIGREANHPDVVIKSKNEAVWKMLSFLSHKPPQELLREFAVVSKLIDVCSETTDRLVKEGGEPWEEFCNDVVNYYCYSSTLFNHPIPIISQAQYDALLARQCGLVGGAKPESKKSQLDMD